MADFSLYTLIKVLAAQLLMPLPLCIFLFVLGLLLRQRWRRSGGSIALDGDRAAEREHMPRAMRHFHNAGLHPIAAPTHYLALRDDPDRLSYWIPSARHLQKTERAFYQWLGSVAVRWE